MKTIKPILFFVGTAIAACSLLPAATAPDLINYQGVLRDAS